MERVEHLWILGLALIALLGSFLLQPRGDTGLYMTVPVSGAQLPLPDTCLSHAVFGISCPGCGLTRSFVAMARGDIASALQLNPCGPLLFILCCLQIPYRVLAYLNVGRTVSLLQHIEKRGHFITWLVVAGLIAAWTARLAWGLWHKDGFQHFFCQLF
ncbi:MAG: DUF2752 domain-containing protein [Desulfomonilaceae bacterium]